MRVDRHIQDQRMKVLLFTAVLLHMGYTIPQNRLSCYKKVLKDSECPNVGQDRMRRIDSLQNHYWEDNDCTVVCYCNFRELLCCPRQIFFGPKISYVIPCKTSELAL
ncbi:scrapie-responsive protein 1-like [Trichomycterus rosablanca]|uniref:scrapie-responsive protein 1-like n=1 Tax=Trichomycterus rosablanca TaxID=2290929 RepID=UPI002F358A7B